MGLSATFWAEDGAVVMFSAEGEAAPSRPLRRDRAEANHTRENLHVRSFAADVPDHPFKSLLRAGALDRRCHLFEP